MVLSSGLTSTLKASGVKQPLAASAIRDLVLLRPMIGERYALRRREPPLEHLLGRFVDTEVAAIEYVRISCRD
ncbi:MAG: hypothetical protein EBW58_11450, partial [Betaproteobacteria bacterium]|nr:hypothetical protein [Betaproteobacteria bacterium]